MSTDVEGPKQVVFRYSDGDNDKDIEVDILGDLPYYQVGEIVARRGKSWKVTQVLIEQSIVGAQILPVHFVSLTESGSGDCER
jgi:hypothetical protein